MTYVDILDVIWFISFLWINIKMYWFTIIWMCFSLSTVHDCFAFVPWNWFQVHIEFRRQCLEMTVDKLLEQFVLNKYTGLEKPGKFIFVIYVSFFISPWPARTRPKFPFDIWCVYVESSATLMPVKCYWCIWCLIEYTSLKGWSFLAFIMNSLT